MSLKSIELTNVLSPLDIAAADDEISLSIGDIVEVTDNSWEWWNVKKADGTEGSEYLGLFVA